MAANGERTIWLFRLARWACVPFSLLGAYVCFRWARELYGVASGILALTLWCFSPNILAHGELVTPDMSATALGVTALYLFWHWLQKPSWGGAIVTGVVLGLAELTKFTWVVLFGLWPLIWLSWIIAQRRSSTPKHQFLAQGGQLALQLLLAVYVINLGYGFEGSGTKLKDFSFVSDTFRGPDNETTGSVNRFAESALKDLPVPLPKNYIAGIDVQKRDFEDFGRPSYLCGQFQEKGWWYYYLYAAAIKIPLGTWVLVILAICHLAMSWWRGTGSGWANSMPLLIPPIVVFTLVSSQTGFSHHFRYVLPCFPFLFIWISQIAGWLAPFRAASWLSAAAVVWSIGSSLWCYPHTLSYFNELAGGPLNGHAHLINSNIDWGQDLLHLKDWMAKHPEARPLYLAYYGYFDPADIGVEYQPAPQRPPIDETHRKPRIAEPLPPGWYAVSVNYLRGYPWRAPRDAYSYLLEHQPVDRAGYSIYIYVIPPADQSAP